ncbi:hypothetical protein M5K25_006755 [Dendrobium thyrsiflorum]|uniref:Uncharacterized protein n=1 Tax=Dendrobium thyrsiflorum TaxID=117978 RepID=A0ABD0VDL1_DENTH
MPRVSKSFVWDRLQFDGSIWTYGEVQALKEAERLGLVSAAWRWNRDKDLTGIKDLSHKRKPNLALGYIISYVLESKYNLQYPSPPDHLPSFYSNSSFHILHNTHHYPMHEELEAEEEGPIPAHVPIWQQSYINQLVQRFDQWEARFGEIHYQRRYLMRGRGKGKKLAIISRHGDPDSGDEQLPVHKRRGRPQKPSKTDANEEESEKNEDEGDDLKPDFKEENNTFLENANKRKRYSQAKGNSDTVLEEKDTIIRSKLEETTTTNGFRHNGSRRKSKPHRAAEAGIHVVAAYKGF